MYLFLNSKVCALSTRLCHLSIFSEGVLGLEPQFLSRTLGCSPKELILIFMSIAISWVPSALLTPNSDGLYIEFSVIDVVILVQTHHVGAWLKLDLVHMEQSFQTRRA